MPAAIPVPSMFILPGWSAQFTTPLVCISLISSSQISLVYWLIMLGVPSGFTPVGIPISGNLEIIAEVSDIADSPGLSIISHSNRIGGIGIAGGLSTDIAVLIVLANLVIHPILTFLVFYLCQFGYICIVYSILQPVIFVFVYLETVNAMRQECDIILILFE